MMPHQTCSSIPANLVLLAILSNIQQYLAIFSNIQQYSVQQKCKYRACQFQNSDFAGNSFQGIRYRGATDTGSYTMWDLTDTGTWFWPDTSFWRERAHVKQLLYLHNYPSGAGEYCKHPRPNNFFYLFTYDKIHGVWQLSKEQVSRREKNTQISQVCFDFKYKFKGY